MHNASRRISVIVAAVGLGASAASAAVTVQYQAGLNPDGSTTTPDAEIREAHATDNYEKGNLNVGVAYYASRSLLSFDLDGTGGLSPGAQIQSISLTLVREQEPQSDDWDSLTNDQKKLELHAVTRDFNEKNITWTQADIGTNWTTPGGDFSSTVLSTNPGTGAIEASFTFDSTSDFVAAAQEALDHNNGVLNLVIIAPNAEADFSKSSHYVKFYSSTEKPAANRPLLTVTAVPEPMGLSLLGLGGMMLMMRRRRADSWPHKARSNSFTTRLPQAGAQQSTSMKDWK